ncbi:MAG: ABC-ATPase domain-containing protein [Gemmatimonadota bacterium]
MRSIEQLRVHLHRLDNRGYKAYREIQGPYDAGDFTLHVDHVQGDPYAAPSRVRAVLPASTVGLPPWLTASPIRRTAAADYLNRALHDRLADEQGGTGSGRSAELWILRPGQQVLERASVGIGPDGAVVARLRAGLPARGRRIPLLPRRSGVDDRPLAAGAVPFQAPESLRVTLQAPHAGSVRGLGVPEGVTVIAGGGYHGKSTLLRAIQAGVYDHIPGDGRERVVAVETAVKVRAEDGRRVEGVDIGNFIGPLPGGQDTRCFRTDNASGSTSQAAAIVEALEVGATALLLDEDTSATNFMIRDARVQRLTPRNEEPITPYIDRARQLADEHGVSTVLVVGGSGDYFDVTDTVIAMRAYVPRDATADARHIVAELPAARQAEGGPWAPQRKRIPLPASIDPSRGRRSVKITTRSEDRVSFGTQDVELGAVEQIVELAQTRAMAEALVWARKNAIDGRRDMADALARVVAAVRADGLGVLHPDEVGEMAAFRVFELAAFLNRLRSLEVRMGEEA